MKETDKKVKSILRPCSSDLNYAYHLRCGKAINRYAIGNCKEEDCRVCCEYNEFNESNSDDKDRVVAALFVVDPLELMKLAVEAK